MFEEANILVAAEAKRRFQLEKNSQKLEEELQQTRLRLEAESAQLNELRSKMQQMESTVALLSPGGSTFNLQSPPAGIPPSVVARLDNSSSSRASVTSDELTPIHSTTSPDDEGVDPVMLSEFVEMVASLPTVPIVNIAKLPYVRTCMTDDIDPCLNFGGNPSVSVKKVLDAILRNSCFVMEGTPNNPIPVPIPGGVSMLPVNSSTSLASPSSQNSPNRKVERSTWERLQGLPGLGPPHQCQACGKDTPGMQPCKYQFRLSETDPWSPICHICRDRIVATVDFINHIRNIKGGLYGSRPTIDLYREALRLKRTMFYARCGAASMAEQERGFGRYSRVAVAGSSTFPRVHGKDLPPVPPPPRAPSPLAPISPSRQSLDIPLRTSSESVRSNASSHATSPSNPNNSDRIKVDVTSVLLNSLN